MSLNLEISLKPKLLFKLLLTPSLRLSLNILQLPLQQLAQHVKTEIEQNPILENTTVYNENEHNFENYVSRNKDKEEIINYLKSLLKHEATIQEHLRSQLEFNIHSKKELEIGEFILGSLDESGYLRESEPDIVKILKVDIDKVKDVLAIIQTFDPAGIAARDLRECLMLQLTATGKTKTLPYIILDKYFDLLEKKKINIIAKKMNVSEQEIIKALEELTSLEPNPAKAFNPEKTRYILPDAFLIKEDQEFSIILNDWEIPPIIFNEHYLNMLKQKDTPQDVQKFLTERLKSAKSLADAINKRKETLKKIIEIITYTQKDFFNNKKDGFKPITISEIAEKLGKHKSTISRAVCNKYLQAPTGVFELKFFINSGIKQNDGKIFSSRAIKYKIIDLIKNENPKKPLSDREIAEHLNNDNINIMRRTVAKYRNMLKIGSARDRRKII